MLMATFARRVNVNYKIDELITACAEIFFFVSA